VTVWRWFVTHLWQLLQQIFGCFHGVELYCSLTMIACIWWGHLSNAGSEIRCKSCINLDLLVPLIHFSFLLMKVFPNLLPWIHFLLVSSHNIIENKIRFLVFYNVSKKNNFNKSKSKRWRIKPNKFPCTFCRQQKKIRTRRMEYHEILYHLESRHKDEYLKTSEGNKTNKDIIGAFKLLYGLGFLKFWNWGVSYNVSVVQTWKSVLNNILNKITTQDRS